MHTEKYSFKGEIAEWREELRRADQDKQIDVLKKGALFLTDVAGIYDVATRPEYRRRGFGSALFKHLVNEAKQAKYESAVLVASAEGAGIYERAGFQKDCVVEEWSFTP